MGLLSTTHIQNEIAPAYPQEIHEHKAPTDESVRLLSEMEEKAREHVAFQIEVRDNEFSGCVTQFVVNQYAFVHDVYIKFTLNGKERNVKRRCPFDTWTKMDPAGAREMLGKAIAEAVTDEVLKTFFSSRLSK